MLDLFNYMYKHDRGDAVKCVPELGTHRARLTLLLCASSRSFSPHLNVR